MTIFKVAYKASTREARITANATATPGGFAPWGTFTHDDDANDGLHRRDSHCVYNHVRHLAYKAGEQNMQGVSITYGAGVSIAPPVG